MKKVIGIIVMAWLFAVLFAPLGGRLQDALFRNPCGNGLLLALDFNRDCYVDGLLYGGAFFAALFAAALVTGVARAWFAFAAASLPFFLMSFISAVTVWGGGRREAWLSFLLMLLLALFGAALGRGWRRIVADKKTAPRNP